MYRYSGIRFDALEAIEKFKVRRKTFEMLSEDVLKRIRMHVKRLPDDVGNNLYYKSMLMLLMDTGARINEILKINKRNVNISDQEILLTQTKTKEDRIVFFSQVTGDIIEKMMRHPECRNHPYLLHNVLKKRPGTYDDVIFIMKKLKKELSIRTLHAHMFRHSMASIWLRHGSDIRSVMDVLGHKNLETTERYLHTSKEHAKRQYCAKYILLTFAARSLKNEIEALTKPTSRFYLIE
jgi:integrase/recombinase XerC